MSTTLATPFIDPVNLPADPSDLPAVKEDTDNRLQTLLNTVDILVDLVFRYSDPEVSVLSKEEKIKAILAADNYLSYNSESIQNLDLHIVYENSNLSPNVKSTIKSMLGLFVARNMYHTADALNLDITTILKSLPVVNADNNLTSYPLTIPIDTVSMSEIAGAPNTANFIKSFKSTMAPILTKKLQMEFDKRYPIQISEEMVGYLVKNKSTPFLNIVTVVDLEKKTLELIGAVLNSECPDNYTISSSTSYSIPFHTFAQEFVVVNKAPITTNSVTP